MCTRGAISPPGCGEVATSAVSSPHSEHTVHRIPSAKLEEADGRAPIIPSFDGSHERLHTYLGRRSALDVPSCVTPYALSLVLSH